MEETKQKFWPAPYYVGLFKDKANLVTKPSLSSAAESYVETKSPTNF